MPGPVIDPKTGKPTEPNNEPPKEGDFVPKSEFDALKQRLDVFEQNAGNFGNQPQAPPTPPAPSGPTFDEQMAKLDKAIESIDSQIDAAVADSKPVSSLMRERDKVNATKIQLRINREIEPKFAAGMQTIDYLSGEVTKGKMPYYDVVRKEVDSQLSQLPADQRMDPRVREAAYNLAVGQNIDKIVAAKEEEIRRSVAEAGNLDPNGQTGRTAGQQYSEGIPKPEDVLGPGAIAALNSKGVTVDEEYRRRGYKGWEDYYEKVGKKYFGEVTGEA